MLLTFFQELIKIDKAIFFTINHSGHASWLDGIMLLLRNQNTWIPLYIFVLYKVYKGSPTMLFAFIVASGLTFFITDYTSASIIKPLVGRLRPCHDVSLSSTINVLLDCGGQYSFPSSHAANHFGLAMVWFNMITLFQQKKWYWVWPWAACICYAQIYVGKHFPLDVIAGAIFGIIAGYLVSEIVAYWFRKYKNNTIIVEAKQPL